jgi:hypothetical protein
MTVVVDGVHPETQLPPQSYSLLVSRRCRSRRREVMGTKLTVAPGTTVWIAVRTLVSIVPSGKDGSPSLVEIDDDRISTSTLVSYAAAVSGGSGGGLGGGEGGGGDGGGRGSGGGGNGGGGEGGGGEGEGGGGEGKGGSEGKGGGEGEGGGGNGEGGGKGGDGGDGGDGGGGGLAWTISANRAACASCLSMT